MDMESALRIAGSGMAAQTERLRVIAENLANADTTGSSPGAAPYRRKTVTFSDVTDPVSGAKLVEVSAIGQDPSAFPERYDPGHPAADANGYVKLPNVNSLVEMMDMREAERSYNANLAVMQVSRGMLSRAIDMLK